MIYFIYFSPLSLKKKTKTNFKTNKTRQRRRRRRRRERKTKLALSRVIYPLASLIYDGRKWAVQKASVASCITLYIFHLISDEGNIYMLYKVMGRGWGDGKKGVFGFVCAHTPAPSHKPPPAYVFCGFFRTQNRRRRVSALITRSIFYIRVSVWETRRSII